MPTIAEIRQKYPQYSDMSDGQLADALYQKFYSDMPREQFDEKVGINSQPQSGSNAMADMSALTQSANNDPIASQAAVDRANFNSLPVYKKVGQAADDLVRTGANGLTFGLADRLAGVINGNGTDAERAKTQSAMNRAGSAGIAADVVGSAVVPMAAASKGLTIAGRLGTGAMTGIPGVAARAGLMATEGAGYGAAQAAGRGEDIGTGAALGALGGGAGSVASDAVNAGVKMASKGFNKLTGAVKPIPELPGLRAQANAAYDAADNAGVIIKPESVQNLTRNVQQELANFGYDPALQPRLKPVIDRLMEAQSGNITLKGMDIIRRVANNARISQAPDERKIANIVVGQIDDFVNGLGKNDVLTGDVLKGSASLSKARELWRRVAKNEELATAVKRAELRAASTGSGGNTENAIRQNLRKILERGNGWTPDEINAVDEIVRGSPSQNVLRLAGKLSPQGNGLMAALGIGGAMVNPALGAASLAGMGAKWASDRGVMQGVKALDELIRSGGTKQSLEAFKGVVKQLPAAKREAIARLFFNIPSSIANSPSYQTQR